MANKIYKCCFRITLAASFLLFFKGSSFVFAGESGPSSALNRGYLSQKTVKKEKKPSLKKEAKKESLSESQLSENRRKARLYRSQGLDRQNSGDLLSAMKLYTMATELDPEYSDAYCDLGIIYEAYGIIDEAEQAYLKALDIDPMFLNVYSNLALLYESKRDFAKAIYYWGKRIELGLPDDPWTDKAKQRLSFLLEGKQNNSVFYETIKSDVPSRDKMNEQGKEKETAKKTEGMSVDVSARKKPVTLVKTGPEDLSMDKRIENLVAQNPPLPKQGLVVLNGQKNIDLLNKEREISLKDQQIDTLKREIIALKEQKETELIEKEDTIDKNKQEFDSLKEKFGYLVLEKEKKIAEKDQEILKMTQQLASLEEKVISLKEENNGTRESVSLKLKIDRLIQEKENVLADKEKELAAKSQQIEFLKQGITDLNRQKEADLARKEREVTARTDQLKSLITSLRSNIHSLTDNNQVGVNR